MVEVFEPEMSDDDTRPVDSNKIVFDEYYVGSGDNTGNDVYCDDSVMAYEKMVYQSNERFYNETDR